MADPSGDRSRFFPAIERKHGGPISVWLDRLAERPEAKYPEQIAYLREEHGFSQAHANALVMYAKGSTSARRFARPEDWFAATAANDPTAAATVRAIFDTITARVPGLALVIAWNHPMLRTDAGQYVIGLSVSKHHVLINPFSAEVLAAASARLADGYEINKRTFAVPVDWQIDVDLLVEVVSARLTELANP